MIVMALFAIYELSECSELSELSELSEFSEYSEYSEQWHINSQFLILNYSPQQVVGLVADEEADSLQRADFAHSGVR